MADVLYGEIFQVAEIITLLLFLPAFYYMLLVYMWEGRWKYFTLAFAWLLFSTIAAIIREFYSFNVFRMLEWICIAIASFLFAYACFFHYITLSKAAEHFKSRNSGGDRND